MYVQRRRRSRWRDLPILSVCCLSLPSSKGRGGRKRQSGQMKRADWWLGLAWLGTGHGPHQASPFLVRPCMYCSVLCTVCQAKPERVLKQMDGVFPITTCSTYTYLLFPYCMFAWRERNKSCCLQYTSDGRCCPNYE